MSRGLDHGPDPSNERAAFAARTLTVADLDAIAEVTARWVAEIVSLPRRFVMGTGGFEPPTSRV